MLQIAFACLLRVLAPMMHIFRVFALANRRFGRNLVRPWIAETAFSYECMLYIPTECLEML